MPGTNQLKWLALLLLLLSGCAAENSVSQCRPIAEQFLLAMSQGKFEQAHELCDPVRVSVQDLKAWTADPGNASMLKDYKGVDWASGGQYTESNKDEHDRPTLRLPPESRLAGRPDVSVGFVFRREESNRWVIIGFALKSGN